MYNRCEVIGNTGSDVDMRFTPTGQPVSTFRLASNRKYTTSDGERKEETDWFTVVCWGKLAETVNQYLDKGRQVFVAGRISLHEWDGQDGVRRSRMQITANDVKFLGSRPGATDTVAGAVGSVPEGPGEGEVAPEDLPF